MLSRAVGLVSAIAVVSSLLLPTPAGAAKGWDDRENIGPRGEKGGTPSVSVTSDGKYAIAAWAAKTDDDDTPIMGAFWRRSSGWTKAKRIGTAGPDGSGVVHTAISGNDRNAMVVWDFTDKSLDSPNAVRWARWDRAVWKPSTDLGTGQGSDIAMSEDGTAIATWGSGTVLATSQYQLAGGWSQPELTQMSMTIELTSVDISEDASTAALAAIGKGSTGQQVMANTWNGTQWSQQPFTAKAAQSKTPPQVDLASSGKGAFLAWAAPRSQVQAARWNGSSWGDQEELGTMSSRERPFSVASSRDGSVGVVGLSTKANQVKVVTWKKDKWSFFSSAINPGSSPQVGYARGDTVVLFQGIPGERAKACPVDVRECPLNARVRVDGQWHQTRGFVGVVSKNRTAALGIATDGKTMVAVWDTPEGTNASIGDRNKVAGGPIYER